MPKFGNLYRRVFLFSENIRSVVLLWTPLGDTPAVDAKLFWSSNYTIPAYVTASRVENSASWVLQRVRGKMMNWAKRYNWQKPCSNGKWTFLFFRTKIRWVVRFWPWPENLEFTMVNGQRLTITHNQWYHEMLQMHSKWPFC